MKTYVQFRSDKFPPYEGEEEQINPGLWGRRLAEYLVEKLTSAAVETEEIIPEDWGWYIPIKNETFRLGLCCGHQHGDDNEFLCFTHPDRPIVRRWFRKIETREQIERLTDALDRILTSDPDIECVHWLTDDEI